MIAKIESFRSMLADVYIMPMAEWLNGFQQYASPEREMMWWQRLTHCYVDYCSRKDLAPEQREAAFNVLCKLGLGATSDDITADLQNLPFGALEELVAETHHDWEVKVVGFYATPDVMRQGEKADLCYGVDNAKSVRLDPPVERVWPSVGRCFEVTPLRDTRYTLIPEDADGHTAVQSLTVRVK